MTAVMGILNVTPDSFSDGGEFVGHDAAISRGQAMFVQGATVVDVGGESTRPGADAVSEEEELRRVIPVIEQLALVGRVSIDTTKPGVARAAVGAGATIINDVSASLWTVAAETQSAWVAMHMQGDPRTMQHDPTYVDVVSEVREFLLLQAKEAQAAGVKEVYVDPGIGFGKTLEHNLALLEAVGEIGGEFPVVVGASRKSFIGRIDNGADAHQRLGGSVAVAVHCAQQGVAMVRVHDVAETVQALRVIDAIAQGSN